MIDPRLFLSIPGPTQPVPLQPGFRPPGPASAPPVMQPQGQQMGIPGFPGTPMGKGMSGGASDSPFKGIDVSNMTPDQQIAAFSTYGNKSGNSPFAGVDVSSMTPDQQIAAFSSYGPQGKSNWPSWLRGLW